MKPLASAKAQYDDYHSEVEIINQLLQSDKVISDALLTKIQTKLDKLADKYQDDADLGSDRYALYQAQALISYKKEDNEAAREWIEQAVTVKGGMYEDAESLLQQLDSTGHTGDRINRLSYLFSVLTAYAIYFGVLLVCAFIVGFVATTNGSDSQTIDTATSILAYVLMIPTAAYLIYAAVLRFHDLGYSGWWILLSLVPFASIIIGIMLLFSPGQKTANKYGAVPRGSHLANPFGS